jgi:hypothetical protein
MCDTVTDDMATAKRARSKGTGKTGRPPKTEGGFDAVLYLRLPQALLDDVDRLTEEENARTGYALDRADVVRKILTDAVAASKAR